MSRINGIPNIVLPNTLFNRITWDIQWSDVIQRRQWIDRSLFQTQ